MDITDSARLRFRLMGQDDAQALWQLDQDPEVMQFINSGQPSSMADIEQLFLPRMKAFTNAEKGWGLWQVSDKITAQYLGWILVRPMDFFSDSPKCNDLEFGWRFFKEAWGKGYATEAATAIKAVIAEQNCVHYLSSSAIAKNSGSIKVMEKIGMTLVKKYTHKDPRGDFNAVLYQMSVK